MAMEIGHVHIKTYDPKKTAQFYIDNFGATTKTRPPTAISSSTCTGCSST